MPQDNKPSNALTYTTLINLNNTLPNGSWQWCLVVIEPIWLFESLTWMYLALLYDERPYQSLISALNFSSEIQGGKGIFMSLFMIKAFTWDNTSRYHWLRLLPPSIRQPQLLNKNNKNIQNKFILYFIFLEKNYFSLQGNMEIKLTIHWNIY